MQKKSLKKEKKSVQQSFGNFHINSDKKLKQNKLRKQKKNFNVEQQKINLNLLQGHKPGEYIVCDLKHMPKSIDGHIYMCVFTCIGTRYSETYFMKTRLSSEFLDCYISYCKLIRNKTGRYPKVLHTDNGKEFVDKCTSTFNKKKGITHTFTAPHNSLQNPIAERINRTIGEGALALLLCAYLPLTFWTYAVTCFSFVKARTPHKSLNLSTPIAAWNIYNSHRTTIDLFDLRIFGCESYVLDENSLKAHPKAFRCIYLGPSKNQKGCMFYNLHTKKIICSRNFVLNEQCMPGKSYFPKIYDRYFGPDPPKELSEIDVPVFTPNSTLDNLNIPYSNLFEFSNNSKNNDEIVIDDDHVSNDNNNSNNNNNNNNEHKNCDDNDERKVVNDDNYVDLSSDSMYVFDRNVFSKVGEGDIPPLVSPSPQQNSSPSSPVPRSSSLPPSPCISTRQRSFSPVSPVPPAPSSSVPVEELHEWTRVVGRRPTKFGRTMGGKWKHGGGSYDYEIEWASGEKTFEPETLCSQYASDAIEDYNVKNHPGSSQHFEAVPDLPDQAEDDQSSPDGSNSSGGSVSFANICNFVHVHFFCYLAKLVPLSDSSWRDIKEPANQNEARNSPQAAQWKAAERKELDSLLAQGTWTPCSKPRKKPITCRWVYKLKPPTTLTPEPIFKARLVAHGYKQKEGEDYSSTFAQVATLKAFRILIWLSVFLGYKSTQLDVKNAFLHGKLDAEIYMTSPPGYANEIGTVRLVKSIYGVKQAPRIWYATLVAALHSLGFQELHSDSCVFRHTKVNCFLLIFVDDIICVTNDEQFRKHFESEMQRIFDIKILGVLRHFIGLQVDPDGAGGVHIHQHDYVQKLADVFKRFFSSFAGKINAPCDPEVKFSTAQQPTSDDAKKKMASYPYRQLIGSLLYLLGTRPEIYFIIISLSRFVQNPGYVHWLAALRVLYYVCNTPLFGIIIKKGQELKLSIYVDSDHGGNTDDRKSMSGYIIYLGCTPIIWRSRRQKGKPALSSCEAEYISLSAGINEIVWIILFLSELGFKVPCPVPMYCDNTSASALAHNPVHHDRTKHIDIRHHRIREFILDGTVEIIYVKSADNPADIFTKSVSIAVFKRLICFVYGKFFA